MEQSRILNQKAVEEWFSQELIRKNSSVAKNKAQLLIEMFSDAANPVVGFFHDPLLSRISSSVDESNEDEDEIISGILTPTPVSMDKQVKNQSTMAKPDAKTSAKNSHKKKKSSEPEATQILTGYEAVREDLRHYSIPVRWFPASWTLRERKQCEKFQAAIHDILEDMTTASLWIIRKPAEFLMKCGASSFKIIQTSKGRELGDHT
ncbi:hypothetical protein RhiirB3_448562 [Rhizophagus irregularis]|nr:hypothetical protein RhiirB3_448562 [Rhizophagus irregularis]